MKKPLPRVGKQIATAAESIMSSGQGCSSENSVSATSDAQNSRGARKISTGNNSRRLKTAVRKDRFKVSNAPKSSLIKNRRAARGTYVRTSKEQREALIAAVAKGEQSTRSICHQLGIHYTTGRNILDRVQRTGHCYRSEAALAAENASTANIRDLTQAACADDAEDNASQDKTGLSTHSEPAAAEPKKRLIVTIDMPSTTDKATSPLKLPESSDNTNSDVSSLNTLLLRLIRAN